MKCLLSSYYYSDVNDFNDEETNGMNKKISNDFNSPHSKHSEKITIEIDYYYHNCLVDVLFKLYAKNLNDKYLLAKHLANLMPDSVELIKLLVSFSSKLNGTQKSLQILYDHLTVHSIDDEHLWIL